MVNLKVIQFWTMSLRQTNKISDLDDEFFIYLRMAEGDHHTLKFFIDKYYDDLCNYLNLHICNQSVSKDIAQDIFIYFRKKVGRLRWKSTFRLTEKIKKKHNYTFEIKTESLTELLKFLKVINPLEY